MSDGNWHCGACGVRDGFVRTIDRMLHVTVGHVGRVLNGLNEPVMYDAGKKAWG